MTSGVVLVSRNGGRTNKKVEKEEEEERCERSRLCSSRGRPSDRTRRVRGSCTREGVVRESVKRMPAHENVTAAIMVAHRDSAPRTCSTMSWSSW